MSDSGTPVSVFTCCYLKQSNGEQILERYFCKICQGLSAVCHKDRSNTSSFIQWPSSNVPPFTRSGNEGNVFRKIIVHGDKMSYMSRWRTRIYDIMDKYLRKLRIYITYHLTCAFHRLSILFFRNERIPRLCYCVAQ